MVQLCIDQIDALDTTKQKSESDWEQKVAS